MPRSLPIITPAISGAGDHPASPPQKTSTVSPQDRANWRWQLRNMMTHEQQIEQVVTLSDAERRGLQATEGMFRVGITPYYADLMDKTNPACPIRMQSIPSQQEMMHKQWELTDPLGEDTHRPTPCIIHKYPDRVLFLVVDRCAIYCRHCNRRRLVGGDAPPSRSQIELGLDYIRNTKRVRDVLLSGGDPLLLSTKRLGSILEQLRAIPHVEIIRIGTRIPVVCPMRIDDELATTLRKYAPVYVNTHFNHPKEITPLSQAACEKLVDAGVPVGNQTVLLRGINSSIRCQRHLMRALVKMRVRPYYLFQGDTVLGTDHLRTSTTESIAIMDGMRGWMSGMTIPHLVLDAPGGGGKIPIGPEYVLKKTDSMLTLRNYRGEVIQYPEPQRAMATTADTATTVVPYDDIYFANTIDDDDREGSSPGDGVA